MMSVSNVAAGAAASGYYHAEGYYVAGSAEAQAAASWAGSAAERLAEMGQKEFQGPVDDATFSAMLEGHAPPTEKDGQGKWKDGQTLGRMVDGERQHRSGIDLTFSASKSVSVMGLVVGDERVVEAHDQAVKSTMAYAEANFIKTRREVNGEITQVPGKMVAGLFRHDTSRAMDPQLHTHAVIQNMVLGEDGKWTALSNEEIYRNKMLLGAIYRNELAQNLEKAGFEVDRVGKDGITEIRGVPQQLMDGFSKRRQEIIAALEERGVEKTAIDSALAALATRPDKVKGVDRAELKAAWEKEAEGFGVTMDQLKGISESVRFEAATRLPGVTRDGAEINQTAEDRAAAVVEFAIEHLSERNAVYSDGDIKKIALSRAQTVGIHEIEAAIAQKEESGRLVAVHVHDWKERQSADGLQPGQGFTGTIISHGAAPYNNDPKNKESYFVTVQTRYGEQTVWGAGLGQQAANISVAVGDLVHLSVTSQTPVVVRTEDGKTINTHRNDWTVELLERSQDRENSGKVLEKETLRLYTDDITLAHETAVLMAFRTARREGGVSLPGRTRPNGSLVASGDALLKQQLSNSTLTEGQKEAVTVGLTGQGRFVGVQGYAGTGKTFMLETMVKYAEKAGYSVEGLAPTQKAAGELQEAIPGSGTVASYLLAAARGDIRGDKSKTILAVDEAGMLSTRDMRALLETANEAQYARVVLVGDVKQLDAVSAGSPFAQLQKEGLPTALMTDIQRQRTDEGRDAVLYAIRGEIKAAFENIKDIRTPGESSGVSEHVASAWLDLHSSVRERTGIVVLTNKVRQAVNEEIRKGLKAEHRLAEQDHRLDTLRPLSFTTAERREAGSFKPGDVLLALRKMGGLEVNKLYEVAETHGRSNAITVRAQEGGPALRLKLGNETTIPTAFAVFEKGERDFSVGDKVKFAISDREAGIINGARGVIGKISSAGVDVILQNGQKTTLAPETLAARGMDHAYAATAHDFQGATVDRIIVGMSANENLSNQKSFYVNISRSRDEVTLITDKPDKLADNIEKNSGERPTALDAYAQRLADERQAELAKAEHKEAPSPAPTHAETNEFLRGQAEKLRDADGPRERSDHELGETLKEIEQMQKVKEGPIR